MTLLSASCGSAAAQGGKPLAYRRIKIILEATPPVP